MPQIKNVVIFIKNVVILYVYLCIGATKSIFTTNMNHEWLVRQKKYGAKVDAVFCKAYRSKKITASISVIISQLPNRHFLVSPQHHHAPPITGRHRIGGQKGGIY